MANSYSFFHNGGVDQMMNGGGVETRKKAVDEQNLNQAVEDQQWNLVAKKLAFEDQMRAKLEHHQSSKGNNLFPSSTPLPAHNSKPAAVGHNKAPKSSSSLGKHKHRGASAQTDMVNRMINKLLTLDTHTAKLPTPSQKGILSSTSSLNSPNVYAPTQTTSPNGSLDKRFKSLPPAESLPRNETLGGYIFVCNNDTMQEDLKRQLFGLPQRYRDSVRAIQPGLPLFLYNYTTHQLHGVFEAASFGGSNIDPTAWEDKKNKGESRFPAQVRIRVRKSCKPLEEDAFRPVLFHYDGPKFRLQLSVPETLALLDLLVENRS
eukprot:c36679_g1_i1 orf=292-1245(+)